MVFTSILFLVISIYFYINYGDKEEEFSLLFIILFIASFIGGIVYILVHLEFLRYKEYNLCTAVFNYFLMLIESTIIFYGFSLSKTNLGWYTQWFFIAFYIFFGIHFFSYPKSSKEAFIALIPYILFILLNLKDVNEKFSSFIFLISKEGYIFSLALLFSEFLMFFLPLLRLKMINAEKSILFIFAVYSLLYFVFILIPGLWFLVSGLRNYFNNSSLY